jgi:hypothetical protein
MPSAVGRPPIIGHSRSILAANQVGTWIRAIGLAELGRRERNEGKSMSGFIVRAALAAATAIVVAAVTLETSSAADRAIRPVVPVAPLAIAPTASGDLLLGFGPMWFDDAPPDVHLWQFMSSGRANLPLGPRWNLEAEANAKSIFESASGGTLGFPFEADGYLHLWSQHNANAAWGLFGGVSPVEAVFWSFGGEFKHYLPHASFGAAVALTGFASLGSSTPGDSGWTVDAAANWYLNPNHRIGLSAALTSGLTFGSSGSGSLWRVTADFEHRFASLPVSLWLAGTREHSAFTGSAWLAMAGFRIFMDRPGSTIQSHERDVPWSFVLPNLLIGGAT